MFLAVWDGGPIRPLEPLLDLDAVETLQQPCREIPGGTALLSNTMRGGGVYRAPGKCLYVVARNFFLLLLNCSAWPCLGPA